MDASPVSGEGAGGPLDSIKRSLRDGVDRYRALRDAPEARRLLLAAAGTYIGYRFNTIALIALSYRLGDGALGVGGMLAILMLPTFGIQPLAGALVDRFQGKRLLVCSQIAMALVAASFLMLSVYPSIWLLYGLTLAMGVVRTVDMPAFEVRLMSLTPKDKRGTANAVQMLAITMGEIIGPALGGVVLALVGTNALFIVQALTLCLLARVVAMLPDKVPGATSGVGVADGAPDGARAPGYRVLLRRPDVRLYIAMVSSVYLLVMGVVPLYIVRAVELGLGEGSVGVFYTVTGIGTFVGGVLAGMGVYTSRRALAVAGMAAFLGALCMIGFGAGGSALIVFPALVLVGVLGDVEEIAGMTYFQNHLPEQLCGRFFSIFMMSASLGGLIGPLASPILADRIGTGFAVATLAVPALIFSLAIAFREGGMRLALPPFAPELEPEVVGHGLFRADRPYRDLLEQRIAGRPMLTPRPARLAI